MTVHRLALEHPFFETIHDSVIGPWFQGSALVLLIITNNFIAINNFITLITILDI